MIVICVVAVFGRATQFEFLQWDDQLHVTANPFVQRDSPDRFVHFWRHPYGKLYVPLTYNLWAVLLWCSEKASLFHGVNIAIHAINTLLVFALLRRWVKHDVASALGALVFALHPLQVESVAWISELRGLLAAMFTLASMICHDRRWQSKFAWRWDVLATLLVALGLLCKPSAVVAPAFMFILDIGFRRPVRASLLSLLVPLLFSICTIFLQRHLQPAPANSAVTLTDRPVIVVEAIWFYVKKLIVPLRLCADYAHTRENVLREQEFFAQLMRLLIVAIVLIIFRSRLVLTAVAIFIIALLPVSGIVPFEFQLISTVADRYTYLALLGPALLIALLIRWKPTTALLVAPVIFALAVLSFRQTQTWRDDTALWTHANAVNPQSAIAECNIAQQALEAGQFDEALRRFTRGISLNPLRNNGQQGLALLARMSGDPTSAERLYREAMAIDPLDPVPATDLISLLATTHRLDDAIRLGNHVVTFSADHADAWNNLGGAYFQKEDLPNAERCVRRAIALHPRHPQAHYALGLILSLKGQDARDEMTLAARWDPSNPLPLIWLGEDAMRRCEWPQAESQLRNALRREPKNLACLNNLGQVLAAADKVDESVAIFELAVQLAPSDPTLRNNLAAARKIRELRAQEREK